jgi:ribonuclease-3
VKDATLAEIAGDIGLGAHLILGPGEKKSGGHRRASILADALEAIFGAVFLDRGIDAATRVIYKALGERLSNIPDEADLRDPKSQLQEWLQSRRLALPVYQLEKTHGKAHRQTFYVSCSIGDVDKKTSGEGSTRRDAEQVAARSMLANVVREPT